MKKALQFLLCVIVFNSKAIAQLPKNPTFEFRAAWVVSLKNTDWPSAKGLTTEQQKQEFINIANMHQKNGMNALIVQMRPAADALYNSPYEPWAEYLSGTQGVAPNPYYDPMEFMIEETHKRGMEFHAWLNPYRAVFNVKESSIAPNHITKTKPEWFITYDNKKFFNPALPEVRDYIVKIITDIITRYNVDGIHIDDYFYPYPAANNADFPDDWYYKKMGNGLSKADWRRSNCDSIIKQIWTTINTLPRRVKFGISPFGVWRNITQDPYGSNTKAGVNNFDNLYADIMLWLKNGWMDYCVPQLYWERKHNLCDYDTLLDWWNKYTFGRHLYIGHGVYRAGTTSGWKNKDELPSQIRNLRRCAATQGSIYFSTKSFFNNPNGWCDSLQQNYYSTPAIVPPMPWIDSVKPAAPMLTSKSDNSFGITYKGKTPIKSYAIFVGYDKKTAQLKQLTAVKNLEELNVDDLLNDKFNKLYIAAVSINNNISELVEVK